MVSRRHLLKLSALGTASFAAPLAYAASSITMTHNTGNPIGSTSPKDLSDNAQSLDYLLLGPNPAYPDRKGVQRKSWKGMEGEFAAGQSVRAEEYAADKLGRDTEFVGDQADRVVLFNHLLKSCGYEIPIDYVVGLSITRSTQVIRFAGELYRAHDANLPFTTTTWTVDAAKLFSMGDASLRQETANNTDPSKGAAMLGRGVVALDSIADLQAAARRSDLRFIVKGYYAGTCVGGDSFYWDPLSTEAADGGGIIQVAGQEIGRFKRVMCGMATPEMYGAHPNDLTQDSAFAFRAALAANDTVWVSDNQYLLKSYLTGAYYGAPAIVLNRDGQSLLCGRNSRLVAINTGRALGGQNPSAMLQIANAVNCTIGAFKIQNRAPVGSDLTSVDTLQLFNAPGAKIGAIDDTFRISPTSGSIQQSIIARDSPTPQTSGTVYKEGFDINGANLSATINVKHHHNMRVSKTKVRIDLDAHRPSWMGSDVAPLKFTGGTINAINAVAEDCEFTVYRSGGGPVAPNLGYIQIAKCTATLSRCVINVSRTYGGSESEADYPELVAPKLSTLHLSDCTVMCDLYFGPSFSIKVTGGTLGSPIKNVQIASLNPLASLALKPELDVSGCDFYCNRALSDRESIGIDISFSDIDLYYTRDPITPQSCFDVHRTSQTWFHADNVRSHLNSIGLFVIFSGNARLSNVRTKSQASTELRLESNSAANPTRVIIDGSFDYKDIYTSEGSRAYTFGIEAVALFSTTPPVTPHNGVYARGSVIFNRSAEINAGWRSDGASWISF